MPFLQTLQDNVPPELRSAAERLCAQPVTTIRRACRGGNNRMYKVETANADYAFKVYPNIKEDPRDRLGVEYLALSFMVGQGIKNVPKPIGWDPLANFGLFEWRDGENIDMPSDSDIDAAIDFIATLHRLSRLREACQLPDASEACLSVLDTFDQVLHRMARLNDVAKSNTTLMNYLTRELRPAFESRRELSLRNLVERGLDPAKPLLHEYQTLSPSDFGFHNSLREPNGDVVFIDFEYFGWDDPVKVTSDFILHPGMNLSEGQRRRFVAGAKKVFSGDKTFTYRLAHMYAFFGYRWCMIILNEFLPERWRRRAYATNQERTVAQMRQLKKAQQLLSRIQETGGEFPYD